MKTRSGSVMAGLRLLGMVQLLQMPLVICGQTPGALDPAFDPEIDGPVTQVLRQVDGKILLAGRFTTINGLRRSWLARLQPSVAADSSFATDLNDAVTTIGLGPDGRILISGSFLRVNGVARTYFARLNPDGSLDPSFDAGNALVASYGGPMVIDAITVQADNKVLIGGPGLRRFNVDGSPDSAFNSGGLTGEASAIALLPDGKIVVGGAFNSYRGVSAKSLLRLYPDGTLDTNFVFNNSFASPVWTVSVLPDGRMVIGGYSWEIAGVTRLVAARLLPDGALDPSFDPGEQLTSDVRLHVGPVQPDGKVVVSSPYLGVSPELRRLNADGSRDTNFDTGTGFPGGVYAVALCDDGKMLVGGNFTNAQSQGQPYLARLFADDNSTLPSVEFSVTQYSVSEDAGHVNLTVRRRFDTHAEAFVQYHTISGTAIAGADFVPATGRLHWHANDASDKTITIEILDDGLVEGSESFVVELTDVTGIGISLGSRTTAAVTILDNETPDNLLDGTFGASGFPLTSFGIPTIYNLLVAPDDKIFVLGSFNWVNGIPRGGFARLNADGSIDTGFNPNVGGVVQTAARLSDGKILIGGYFTTVAGLSRTNFARLLPDGSLDATFVPSPELSRSDGFITAQPDGKFLIASTDGSWNGTAGYIRRFNPDGTPDATFHTLNLSDPDSIRKVLVQLDGSFIVVGSFSGLGMDIIRLNANGTIDPGFTPPALSYYWLSAAALQPGGKVLLSGLTSVLTEAFVVRLNSDGTLDESFQAPNTGGAGYAATVQAIVVQADGAIVIGGGFDEVGGLRRHGVARLRPDGSLDPLFDPGSGIAGDYELIYTIGIQSDGRIVVGGNFTSFNGQPYLGLARLLPGSSSLNTLEFVASSYAVSEGAGVAQVVVQRGGPSDAPVSVDYAIDGGTATPGADYVAHSGTLTFAPLEVQKIIPISIVDDTLLEPDETIYLTLSHPTGGAILGVKTHTTITILDNEAAPSNLDGNFDVGLVFWARQPDGKLLVSLRSSLFRLNPNGSEDGTFKVVNVGRSEDTAFIRTVTLQSDGKVLVGGYFSNIGLFPNMQGRPGLSRLNTDGSVDTGFMPEFDSSYGIAAIAVQPDGKVIAGGGSVVSQVSSGFVRLLPNGHLDTNFSPRLHVGSGYGGSALALQPDGKILIGGYFDKVNGVDRNDVARLNSDGSLDETFDATVIGGFTYGAGVHALALQADGKIVVGGAFTFVNGVALSNLARLDSHGGLDGSFGLGAGADGQVNAIVVQPDGRFVIGGNFFRIDGARRAGLARLNTDGSADLGFAPALPTNSYVLSIGLVPDGSLLAGGNFCFEAPDCDYGYDGCDDLSCPGTIRILPDPPMQILAARHRVGGPMELSVSGFPGRTYVLQASSNLRDWISLATNAPATGVSQFVDSEAAVFPQRFYRLLER